MATLVELEAELVAAKAAFSAEKQTMDLDPTEFEMRIAELEVLIPNHPDNDPVS